MTTDAYLGNPNLKKIGTQLDFTQHQIQEYLRCKEDPVYFAMNYIKIISLDEGIVPFKMWDFQQELIESFHENRFNIAKLPRQTGKSTTCVSYLLHYILFNDNVNVGILANKLSTARDLLGRLQLAYEQLPMWLQQGIVVYNKGSMELEKDQRFSLHLLQHLLSEVCRLTSSSSMSLRLYLTILQSNSLVPFILLLLLVHPQKSSLFQHPTE